jgi:hypothetical protein
VLGFVDGKNVAYTDLDLLFCLVAVRNYSPSSNLIDDRSLSRQDGETESAMLIKVEN